jgi:pimeloyl-ACP methyl ester carboxylesterase
MTSASTRTCRAPDGASLFYRAFAAAHGAERGIPIVLLHATLSASVQLAGLARLLAVRGPVFALDRRGSGESAMPVPRPLDVVVHVADVAALLDAEEIAVAILVGHSFGGVVALEAAARLPGRVSAVVAWEPPYGPLADADTRARFASVAIATERAYAAGGTAGRIGAFCRDRDAGEPGAGVGVGERTVRRLPGDDSGNAPWKSSSSLQRDHPTEAVPDEDRDGDLLGIEKRGDVGNVDHHVQRPRHRHGALPTPPPVEGEDRPADREEPGEAGELDRRGKRGVEEDDRDSAFGPVRRRERAVEQAGTVGSPARACRRTGHASTSIAAARDVRSARGAPARAARSSARRSLPDAVRGSTATTKNPTGILYGARRARQKDRSSAFVGAGAPGRSTTAATGTAPQVGSGRPTTPASAIAGCSAMVASTSAGTTFSPPEISRSSRRSSTWRKPSASSRPASPVRSHPSGSNAAAVSSGRPR